MKNVIKQLFAICAILVLAATPAFATGIEGTGTLRVEGEGSIEIEGNGKVQIRGTGIVKVANGKVTGTLHMPGFAMKYTEEIDGVEYTVYEATKYGSIEIHKRYGSEMTVLFEGKGKVKAKGTGLSEFEGKGNWNTY